jgi:protein-arginine kinase activator protein McsA
MRKTNEQFIEESQLEHGTEYDYSQTVYYNYHSKVIIGCRLHGLFYQSPAEHLRGYGCRLCGIKRSADKKRTSLDKLTIKANKTHNNQYDYSQVKYISTHTKITILCPKHGPFEQTPSDHLQGYGCPTCAIVANSDRQRKSLVVFKEQGNKTHNNRYDYSQVKYISTHTKVIIICPEHGSFEQEPASHLSGKGCPKCGINQLV